MIFSRQTLIDLIQSSASQRDRLEETYGMLPATRCQRQTRCCSMLPEMTLVEALAGLQLLKNMESRERLRLFKRIVTYFLINPAELTACPFLEGRGCLIYPNRFFGCRAYGLWPKEYYDAIAGRSRTAKQYIQQQWQGLGVSLPREVVDFQLPYCQQVEIEGKETIDEKKLLQLADRVENLSEEFADLHQAFNQNYFADLSFLITGLMFGVNGAVQKKFTVVRDLVANKDRTELDRTLNQLPDILAGSS